MRRGYASLLAITGISAVVLLTAAPSWAAPGQAGSAGPAGSTATTSVTGAGGDQLYQQTFGGGSVPQANWIAGGSACLTAGTSAAATGIPACPAGERDAAGQGVLRLSANKYNQTGYALYTQPVEADRGLSISFNMYQYDATTKPGADGISFLLVNGSQSPAKAGAFGGALGYKGLAGGYLGIGFDEFGNYSTRAIWGNGTEQKQPNSIVVRGAQSAGYPTIRRITASRRLANDAATSRNAARRHVVITISTSGAVTVKVDYGSGMVTEVSNLNLNDTQGQPTLPATVKFGFAGSTGNNTDIHEVSDLTISALPPDLHAVITPNGTFQAGGTGTFVTVVSNDPTAGPTTGPVSVTDAIPVGFTPTAASGTGWTCGISGQLVTCTRPDTLPPGRSYPPFTVTTAIAPNAPSTVTVAASATTPDLASPANAQTSVNIPVQPGPALSTTLTPEGQFLAPGIGTYLLTVANAATGGPTLGPVTETFPVPAGQAPVSATGRGWTCGLNGQQVTCVNQATLLPAQTYQPIVVTVQTGALTLHPAAQVGTPGDTGQPGEVSPPVSVQLTPVAG
jgi:Bacterial lectin